MILKRSVKTTARGRFGGYSFGMGKWIYKVKEKAGYVANLDKTTIENIISGMGLIYRGKPGRKPFSIFQSFSSFFFQRNLLLPGIAH
jgi:hypothetical protein